MDMVPPLLRFLYGPFISWAARRSLEGLVVDQERHESGRWSRREVNEYLGGVWQQVDRLLPLAHLRNLPTRGNRHVVFLAVVTTAAYRALLDRGVSREYATVLVRDIGWQVYSVMLRAYSLPHRLSTRDPRLRLERTLRSLMRFPFSAPGRPGYEVEFWIEGDQIHTHWTHCPPQAFVRELVQAVGDRGEVEAFRRSWCEYDWPGADLIAADGRSGHYERTHTLSEGDSVCDMCWRGRASAMPSEAP